MASRIDSPGAKADASNIISNILFSDLRTKLIRSSRSQGRLENEERKHHPGNRRNPRLGFGADVVASSVSFSRQNSLKLVRLTRAR